MARAAALLLLFLFACTGGKAQAQGGEDLGTRRDLFFAARMTIIQCSSNC